MKLSILVLALGLFATPAFANYETGLNVFAITCGSMTEGDLTQMMVGRDKYQLEILGYFLKGALKGYQTALNSADAEVSGAQTCFVNCSLRENEAEIAVARASSLSCLSNADANLSNPDLMKIDENTSQDQLIRMAATMRFHQLHFMDGYAYGLTVAALDMAKVEEQAGNREALKRMFQKYEALNTIAWADLQMDIERPRQSEETCH